MKSTYINDRPLSHLLPFIFFALIILASPVFAATTILVRDLPAEGEVTLSGTVEKLTGGRTFMLSDSSGSIPVKISPNESLVLKDGEKVNVTGSVGNAVPGFTGKGIAASHVERVKDAQTSLSDAVAVTTGISVEKADSVTVAALPTEGMVKLVGIVSSVSDEKFFVLRDDTGSVNVKVQSEENVVLKQGSHVTVIGYVDNGMLDKTVRATRVVVNDTNPAK